MMSCIVLSYKDDSVWWFRETRWSYQGSQKFMRLLTFTDTLFRDLTVRNPWRSVICNHLSFSSRIISLTCMADLECTGESRSYWFPQTDHPSSSNIKHRNSPDISSAPSWISLCFHPVDAEVWGYELILPTLPRPSHSSPEPQVLCVCWWLSN